MSQRPTLIVGNWKLYGTRKSAAALLRALAPAAAIQHIETAICPPAIFLNEAKKWCPDAIALGAQDCSAETEGAFTGEIAAAMLKEYHCRYVIVGHSERRRLYAEDDSLCCRKFIAARRADLLPIYCVGETLEEREQERTEAVIEGQIEALLDTAGVTALRAAAIAYEPVWAIGSGLTATPQQADQVHQFIRQCIARRDADIAAALPILYGGSVKADNAAALLAMDAIDGALVGGASLDVDSFLAICHAAQAPKTA